MKKFLGFLIIILIVTVIGWWIYASNFKKQTVEEYRNEIIHEINKELSDPENEVRREIEHAHLSVTVKSAKVIKCVIKTIDETNNAGINGSNISEIEIVISTRWDGILHKNGYTDIKIICEAYNGQIQLKDAQIIATNALINTTDPNFWYGVGVLTKSLLESL